MGCVRLPCLPYLGLLSHTLCITGLISVLRPVHTAVTEPNLTELNSELSAGAAN